MIEVATLERLVKLLQECIERQKRLELMNKAIKGIEEYERVQREKRKREIIARFK